MNREEQLRFCKTCQNQKISFNQGVICKISDRPPDFEHHCDLFTEDTDLVNRLNRSGNSIDANIAGIGRRFANHVLDMVFICVFYIAFGFILGIFLAFFSPSSLSYLEGEHKLLEYAFSFIVFFLYYSTYEAMTGRTLAKFITKTKVIDENGLKPSYKMIMQRTLYRLVPFDALSFLGDSNLGWHDKWSKTKVVYSSK